MPDNPEDRRKAAQSYIESVGGKLHGFWYAFGTHDGYNLWDEEPTAPGDGLLRQVNERQAMKFDYDPQEDALYVRLNEAAVVESEEVQPGIILDFDEDGTVVGVEVLRASQRATPTPVRTAA